MELYAQRHDVVKAFRRRPETSNLYLNFAMNSARVVGIFEALREDENVQDAFYRQEPLWVYEGRLFEGQTGLIRQVTGVLGSVFVDKRRAGDAFDPMTFACFGAYRVEGVKPYLPTHPKDQRTMALIADINQLLQPA